MCFGMNYDCSVYCVNAYLNTTELANKTISRGCSISCAEGVMDTGWATTSSIPAEPNMGMILIPLALIIAVAIIVAANWWYGRRK